MLKVSSEAESYWERIERAFEQAQLNRGRVVQHYSIAGLTVELNFAGPALVHFLTQALDHLKVTSEKSPKLRVCIWDSMTTGVPLQAPPLGDALLPMGQIPGFNTERFSAIYNITGQILYFFDQVRQEAFFWAKDPATLPEDIKGLPLRPIFHWWLSNEEMQIAHAGLVGLQNGKGALIVGQGGVGKSTTMLTCLKAGLLYGGDDRIILQFTEKGVLAHSLYRSARLTTVQLNQTFPDLASYVVNPNRGEAEKALLILDGPLADCLVASPLTLSAILLPSITGQNDTSVEAVSGAKALVKLVPGTMFPQRMPTPGEFMAQSTLVKQIPCYQLNLGTELSQIPSAIERLIL